jgi:hypothetical protein
MHWGCVPFRPIGPIVSVYIPHLDSVRRRRRHASRNFRTFQCRDHCRHSWWRIARGQPCRCLPAPHAHRCTQLNFSHYVGKGESARACLMLIIRLRLFRTGWITTPGRSPGHGLPSSTTPLFNGGPQVDTPRRSSTTSGPFHFHPELFLRVPKADRRFDLTKINTRHRRSTAYSRQSVGEQYRSARRRFALKTSYSMGLPRPLFLRLSAPRLELPQVQMASRGTDLAATFKKFYRCPSVDRHSASEVRSVCARSP